VRRRMTKDKAQAPEEMTYEEAFEELSQIVQNIEGDDLTLEEGLARFERGQALAARCTQLLEEADLKLRQLITREDGEVVEGDLSVEDEG
jgi:exodeoxyribonuclease VII small subunit